MVVGLGVRAFSETISACSDYADSALIDLGRSEELEEWDIDPYKNGSQYSQHLSAYGTTSETIKVVKDICRELIAKKLKESA